MEIRIRLYAVPRSFQTLTKEERDDFKAFLNKAIDEQLEIYPENLAVKEFLPFTGPARVTIHWCINTTNTDNNIQNLNWGDVDNIAKPLIDSLQGKIIENDRQVVEVHLFKHSIRNFALSNEPAVKMPPAIFGVNRAVSLETDFVFIEVSNVAFHV